MSNCHRYGNGKVAGAEAQRDVKVSRTGGRLPAHARSHAQWRHPEASVERATSIWLIGTSCSSQYRCIDTQQSML
jgi:hypothetical protein